MNADGDTTEIRQAESVEEPCQGHTEPLNWYPSYGKPKKNLLTQVWADSAQRAVKVANERRIRSMALGEHLK